MNVMDIVNDTSIPAAMTSLILVALSHRSMTRRDTKTFASAMEKRLMTDVNVKKPRHTVLDS